MNRIVGTCGLVLLGIAVLSGCQKGDSGGSSASAGGAAAQASADPSKEPAAIATADFMEAVLKGDSQRASARLTPTAMERIVASGKQFQPPGWQTATFKITQVRSPSADQAIVQCMLTDTAAGSPQSTEEMCCLLRRVDNDWRVCGIAYGTGDNQSWTLNDFETGRTIGIPRQPSMNNGTAAAAGTAGRPSPPRTAQEPSNTDLR
jgi:hypothetical protein